MPRMAAADGSRPLGRRIADYAAPFGAGAEGHIVM